LARFSQRAIALGLFVDYPQFAGQWGRTSYVVSLDKFGRLETRKGRYLLVSEIVENEQGLLAGLMPRRDGLRGLKD
jgi:hypothetical protein